MLYEALKENTLLNNIVLDLLPIIDVYFNAYQLFAIGNPFAKDVGVKPTRGSYEIVYGGYRMVTKDDFMSDTFFASFREYYRVHNGLPSLDNFKGGVLCCQKNNTFVIDNYYVRCTPSTAYWINNINIEFRKIYSFKTSNRKSEILWNNNKLHFRSEFNIQYKIGLFVREKN